VPGAGLPLSAIGVGGLAALALVAARAAGKFVGVFAFAPLGGLKVRQAVGLACALLPMSTLALVLQHDIMRAFPQFDPQLSAIFLAAILLMEIVGPIVTQWGLRFAGEPEPEPDLASTIPPIASKAREA